VIVRSYNGLVHAEIWQHGEHALEELPRMKLRFSRITHQLITEYAGLNKTASAIIKSALLHALQRSDGQLNDVHK
jgi:hypothetical protein